MAPSIRFLTAMFLLAAAPAAAGERDALERQCFQTDGVAAVVACWSVLNIPDISEQRMTEIEAEAAAKFKALPDVAHRLEAADEMLRRPGLSNGDRAAALALRATVRETEKGDREAAFADYTEAVRLDPESRDRRCARAGLGLKLSRFDETIADTEWLAGIDAEAITDTDLARCIFTRAEALREKGDYRRSLAEYERIKVSSFNFRGGLAQAGQGKAYLALGDYRRAVEHLSEALITENEGGIPINQVIVLGGGETAYYTLYNLRGIAFHRSGDELSAEADFRTFLARQPGEGIVWVNLGAALNGLERHGEALEAIEEGVELGADGARARFHRANALKGLERFEEALANYRHSLDMDPHDAEARLALAELEDALAAKTAELAAFQAGAGAAADLPAIPRKRVALVLINDPVGAEPPPAAPDQAISLALGALGFEVVEAQGRLSQQDLLGRLGQFAETAAGADWAIVVYGGEVVSADGENYLVPSGARLDSARSVPFATVPQTWLAKAVEGAKSGGLVFIDACAIDSAGGAQAALPAGGGVTRGFMEIDPPEGTLFFAAQRAGGACDERKGRFLASLAAQFQAKTPSIGKLVRLVRDEVVRDTRGLQEPIAYGKTRADDLMASWR